VTCPVVGDSLGKLKVILDDPGMFEDDPGKGVIPSQERLAWY
jgi:hypothetical protein